MSFKLIVVAAMSTAALALAACSPEAPKAETPAVVVETPAPAVVETPAPAVVTRLLPRLIRLLLRPLRLPTRLLRPRPTNTGLWPKLETKLARVAKGRSQRTALSVCADSRLCRSCFWRFRPKPPPDRPRRAPRAGGSSHDTTTAPIILPRMNSTQFGSVEHRARRIAQLHLPRQVRAIQEHRRVDRRRQRARQQDARRQPVFGEGEDQPVRRFRDRKRDARRQRDHRPRIIE